MRLRSFVLAAFLSTLPVFASAQGDGKERPPTEAELFGDPAAGFRYAQEVCAGCHAVEGDAQASFDPAAPPFGAIAETPGMNARAITVWLTTFHPERSMPALVLEPEDRANVIAYILSLAE